LIKRAERPIWGLPRSLLMAALIVSCFQLIYHYIGRTHRQAGYQALSTPFDVATYRGMAMGSEKLLGYLLAIRLQLHDTQAGRYFRYSLIDYHRLTDWLKTIDQLDPSSEYTMLLASRVYSQTRDKKRLRMIIQYIDRTFKQNPQLHWRRMAEASVMVKHKLGDLHLALALADELARQPGTIIMPLWARDMKFLLLAELNELESSIAIIERMLKSAAVSDPDEKRFLEEKLSNFQQKLFKSRQKTK